MKTISIKTCLFTIILTKYSTIAQNTNNSSPPYLKPESSLKSIELMTSDQDQDFSNNYLNEFDKKSLMMFSDSFGWQSDLDWIRSYSLKNNFNSRISQISWETTRKSTFDSLRESFIQLPIISNSKNWLNQLFINSIGQTTQESVNVMDASALDTQKSWWNEMRSNGNVVYGFRPLDGNMFCSTRFGHWQNNPIGIAFASIHVDPVILRSSIDDQISIYLPWSSMLNIGMSFELTDPHNKQHDMNWSVTITHTPDNKIFGGCELFAGISDNNHEMIANTGLHWSY